MNDLRIVGPWRNHSGYSKLARAVLRTALVAGYKVQAVESDYRVKRSVWAHGEVKEKRLYANFSKKYPVPIVQRMEVERALRTKVRDDAPTLFIQFPEQVGGWPEYSYGPRIAWTMIESDRITNRDWRMGLYGCDLLLAPSRYVWNTFKRDVPEVPLELLYLPVDDRIYTTEPEDDGVVIAGRYPDYLFMSVFNCRERKQWRMMMQAFYEEFKEDESVGFLIRPSSGIGEVQEMAGWIRSVKAGAKRHCYVLNKWLSEESLAAYYRRADCYVLPSCEGFGLPYVEAGLCGTPSIALDGGGAWDVVTPNTGWRVPHKMEPVYGNLPHVYDSTHKFAVPESINEVRWAMRRAYESNEDKGEHARHYALTNFTPHVIAPKLRELIEQAYKPFSTRTVMWQGADLPKWGLCVGDGYGDALAVLGHAQSVLRGNLGARINILHYGANKGLEEFWRLQPCIGDVKRIEPPDKETAVEVGNSVGAYYSYPKEKWWSELGDTGIKPEELAETQVRWIWGTWPVIHPKHVVLSEAAVRWAEQKRAELGEFVLVQPFSTSSVGMGEHWPYWIPFLRWLLEVTQDSHLLVFCGLNKIPGLKGPNVVDLIGETPSMQHVFALCDQAKGTITTCNALANWAAVRGNKALIAGNQAIPRPSQFWPRFMTTKTTKLCMVNTSLPAFIKHAEKFLQGISK